MTRRISVVSFGRRPPTGHPLDFSALQRRLVSPRAATEAPASFLVFDVLGAGGTDLRGYPYRVRRAVLQRLLGGVALPLALVPITPLSPASPAVKEASNVVKAIERPPVHVRRIRLRTRRQ